MSPLAPWWTALLWAGGGMLAGWALGGLIARATRSRLLAERDLERARRADLEASIERERARAADAAREAAVFRERAEQAQALAEGQRAFLEQARRDLEAAFQAHAAQALQGSSEQFLRLAEQRLARSRSEAGADLDERRQAIDALLAPLRSTLERLDQRTGELERTRLEAYSRLDEQLRGLASATAVLGERAASLNSALRGSTQARGRWGEVALRNVVELAGLTEHCDFEEQQAIEGGRPDLVVRLPGGRFLAVDAKAPATAFFEAAEATDEAVRRAALERHARDLRQHVKALAQREYARALDGSLDFVVLFLPGEPLLSAAFAVDPELQVGALRSKVLIATPTTLLALLRTAAHFWQQSALADNAAQIASTAQLLYDRAVAFADHLADIGRHLGRTTAAYNRAVGSFESRLRPLASRIDALRIMDSTHARLDAPPRVDVAPRPVLPTASSDSLPFPELAEPANEPKSGR